MPRLSETKIKESFYGKSVSIDFKGGKHWHIPSCNVVVNAPEIHNYEEVFLTIPLAKKFMPCTCVVNKMLEMA